MTVKLKARPRILVMQRRKNSGKQWGMEHAFPIDHYGIKAAVEMAQNFIAKNEYHFGDTLEYKLEGGME